MKRVAPEQESLMWTLAEEGNERAIDEFGERYPELRSELLRRIDMVKSLKGAKRKPAETPKPIPRFVPREVKSTGPGYLVGGLVLAALGALVFAVTTLLSQPVHGHPGDPVPKIIVQDEAPHSAPQQGVAVPQLQPGPQQLNSPQAQTNDAPLRQGTLRIKSAPLLTVLEMIGTACGVKIQAAQGMPNPDVYVDYQDRTAMEMLLDLGRQYGFTPMDQYDGSIIVIPVVDPNSVPQDQSLKGPFGNRKVGG